MKLHYLISAVAASALMAGAAHAQLGAGTPDTGTTGNQAAPADPKESQTGLPSVDSTRATGAGAGETNLPNGEVNSSSDATTSGVTSSPTPDTSYSTSSAASASSSGSNASMSGSTQVVTNGPVPDTAENRAKYGAPMSRAGKRTAPAGN
ncbi:MAG TPA: hypothetical protein VIO94_14050 [Phenylobacterium sp.]